MSTIEVNRLVCVVCTKDRPPRVKDLVEQLLTTGVPPRVFLLVDSTSAPSGQAQNAKNVARLAESGWEATHISDSPGLPHQRNTALEYIFSNYPACEIVSFLDDDILIDRDYFENVITVFDHDPNIVVVGGFDRTAANPDRRLPKLFSRLGIVPDFDGQIAKSGLARVPRPVSFLEDVHFVPGGMQSLRLSLLKGLRFNEESAFFGEDIEMHFKLSRNGRVVSSNLLAVSHLNATEGKEDNGPNFINEQLVRLRLHLEDSSRVTYGRMLFGCIIVFAWESLGYLKNLRLGDVKSLTRQFLRAFSISLARQKVLLSKKKGSNL